MQFHLRFNEPSDVWPQGSWALYQITGDEIAKCVEFGPDGNAVRRDGWPGYIATFATVEGAAAQMRHLVDSDPELRERAKGRIKGKFYIWMNAASTVNHYWMQHAQNWTTTARDATFFDTREQADVEAKYARDYGPGEVFVRQATRELA